MIWGRGWGLLRREIEAVYELVGVRWYPVYNNLANAKVRKDQPSFDGFPNGITSATPIWLPAQATPDLLIQLSAVDQKLIYAEILLHCTRCVCGDLCVNVPAWEP